MTTLISLCQNAALLALGVLAYSVARPRMAAWPAAARIVCSGALFAVLAMLSMLAPLLVVPGFILDARNTMVALATVFAGPLAGAMAALPAGLYRLGLGGPGAPGALYGLTVAVLFGWALRHWAARRGRAPGVIALGVLGVAISLALVPSVFLIYDGAQRLIVLRDAMAPFALSIVLGLPAFGILVLLGDRQRSLQQAIDTRDQVLREGQHALVGILKDELLAGRTLDRQLRAIARTGADALRLELLTIWAYDETRPVARCLERWDGRGSDPGHVPPGTVPDTHYDRLPDMRAALTRNLSYRAVDARADPITGPLVNEAYGGTEPISMLYAGIRHADRLVGHIAFGTVGRQRDWTIEEETFARSLADLVGLALLQSQLDRKETALRRNLELLVRMVREELLRDQPLAAMLRSVTETIGAALDIERTSIWQLDHDAAAYRCLELWDNRERRHVGHTLSIAAIGPDVIDALQRDFVVVIDDVARDPRLTDPHRTYLLSVPIKSAMLIQIGLPTEPFGALVFSSIADIRAWSLEDQTVARSIADLIGLALLKDQLDRREEALRRNQSLVIQLVRDELLRTATLTETLQSMAERIGSTLEIDRTSVWQFDHDAERLDNVARWDNLARRHVAGGTLPTQTYAPLYEQLRRDIVVEVDDVARALDFQGGGTPLEVVSSPKTALISLIGSPDRPIGVLAFASETPRGWALEEQTLIRSLSQLIAFAFLSQSYREAIAALDLVSEGIYVQSPSNEIIYANRTARELAPLGEAVPQFEQAIGDASGSTEVSWTLADGARRELAISRRQLPNGGAVTMLSDVTDENARRRLHDQLEEQLRQTTKMEAVGRLAGGIAHDFNNMIGSILGFATFLAEDLPAGSAQQAFAQRITEVCARSRDVVKQLLTFSRPGDVDRRLIDLRSAVTENAELLRAALPSAIRLEIEPGAVPLPVLVNAAQIYQVLLNLCGNANDAIEGPGSIVVSLGLIDRAHRDRRLFEAGAHKVPGAIAFGGRLEPDRRYAVLRVTDSGTGMDQETLDRVFEPFFTTKPRSRGTGLGLAVVHGIVNACQGAYLVRSQVGGGSTFSLYLPLTQPDAARGGESVLIVDDDVDVADMLSIALERLGYDVTCCNDPAEALEAFEQDPGAWDVVITDQMMPGLTGLELIARLKAILPDCLTVLCTGFADDVSPARASEAGVDVFIHKPIEPRDVADRLRALLDRRIAELA